MVITAISSVGGGGSLASHTFSPFHSQNPKKFTFLSTLCSPPLSSLQSPLFSLFSSAQQTTAQGLKQGSLSLSLILCSPPLSTLNCSPHRIRFRNQV